MECVFIIRWECILINYFTKACHCQLGLATLDSDLQTPLSGTWSLMSFSNNAQLLPGIQSLANSGLCLESLQRERVEVAPRGQGSLLTVISVFLKASTRIQQEFHTARTVPFSFTAHTGTHRYSGRRMIYSQKVLRKHHWMAHASSTWECPGHYQPSFDYCYPQLWLA